MTNPAAFPAPPDVALHAALAGSALVDYARGAAILYRTNTVALYQPFLTSSAAYDRLSQASKHRRAAEMQHAAATPLRPWGADLQQAFRPVDLWTFSFITREPITATEAAIERDVDLVSTARVVHTFLRAVQHDVATLGLPLETGQRIVFRIEQQLTEISLVLDKTRIARALSSAPALYLESAAAPWLAGCTRFEIHGAFPWPSAHERLAIEKEFSDSAALKGRSK
jgi:hypothetical protein